MFAFLQCNTLPTPTQVGFADLFARGLVTVKYTTVYAEMVPGKVQTVNFTGPLELVETLPQSQLLRYNNIVTTYHKSLLGLV
jgi:hypothetical protein